MSPNERNDLLPLLVILESIAKIRIYAKDFEQADRFFQHDDQAKFNASLLLLLNIGEQFGKLSNRINVNHSYFPFDSMRGLRNRIAHDYIGIDYEMVFDIVKRNIPDLELSVTALLKNDISAGVFDMGELSAARHSPFYKHIDFGNLL